MLPWIMGGGGWGVWGDGETSRKGLFLENRVKVYLNNSLLPGQRVLIKSVLWVFIIAMTSPLFTPKMRLSVKFSAHPASGKAFHLSFPSIFRVGWHTQWRGLHNTHKTPVGFELAISQVSEWCSMRLGRQIMQEFLDKLNEFNLKQWSAVGGL